MAFTTGRDSGDVVSEINITPLVDVMLVLMVVFILTAPLLNNAVRINLPKTATTTLATQAKSVTVSVDGENRIYIDKREVTLGALEGELRTLVGSDPDLALSLQADQGVPYRSGAQVIAHIQRSGVSKLSVLTEPAG